MGAISNFMTVLAWRLSDLSSSIVGDCETIFSSFDHGDVFEINYKNENQFTGLRRVDTNFNPPIFATKAVSNRPRLILDVPMGIPIGERIRVKGEWRWTRAEIAKGKVNFLKTVEAVVKWLNNHDKLFDIVWQVNLEEYLRILDSVEKLSSQQKLWTVNYRRAPSANPAFATGCAEFCIVHRFDSFFPNKNKTLSEHTLMILNLVYGHLKVKKVIGKMVPSTWISHFKVPTAIGELAPMPHEKILVDENKIDEKATPCTSVEPKLYKPLKEWLKIQKVAEQKLKATGILENAVIYRCVHGQECGGHGDRIQGIFSILLIAIATNRGFFIEITKPISILSILKPRRSCRNNSGIFFWPEMFLNSTRNLKKI